MKKNIGFAGLDSTLAKWIYEKLRLAAPDTGNVDELMEGVEDLISGRVSTLMLELIDEDHTVSMNQNVLHCGALTVDPRLRKVVRDEREMSLPPTRV